MGLCVCVLARCVSVCVCGVGARVCVVLCGVVLCCAVLCCVLDREESSILARAHVIDEQRAHMRHCAKPSQQRGNYYASGLTSTCFKSKPKGVHWIGACADVTPSRAYVGQQLEFYSKTAQRWLPCASLSRFSFGCCKILPR